MLKLKENPAVSLGAVFGAQASAGYAVAGDTFIVGFAVFVEDGSELMVEPPLGPNVSYGVHPGATAIVEALVPRFVFATEVD